MSTPESPRYKNCWGSIPSDLDICSATAGSGFLDTPGRSPNTESKVHLFKSKLTICFAAGSGLFVSIHTLMPISIRLSSSFGISGYGLVFAVMRRLYSSRIDATHWFIISSVCILVGSVFFARLKIPFPIKCLYSSTLC